MNEVKVKFTGWKALCVGGAVFALLGYRAWTARQSLDDNALEPIKLQLLAEYTGESMEKIHAAIRAIEKDEAEAEYEDMIKLDEVELTSVSARGKPSESVVRVEFTLRGAPPPDGRSVRYYRMKYSVLTGWQYPGSATWMTYYLALFTLF